MNRFDPTVSDVWFAPFYDAVEDRAFMAVVPDPANHSRGLIYTRDEARKVMRKWKRVGLCRCCSDG
jgi:hypothetical protein